MKVSLAAISLFSVCVAEQPWFTETAGQFLEVQLRGRDKGPDITEVEVYITPDKMLIGNEVGVDNLSLQMQVNNDDEEVGCWKTVGGRPTKRALRYRWRVPILPCLPNSFRLVLQPPDMGCQEVLHHNTTMGNAPLYMVEKARRFTPAEPEKLRMQSSTLLAWDPVPCASHYIIQYSEGEGIMTTILEDKPFTNLTLPSECGQLKVDVLSVSGKRTSRGAKITLNTCGELPPQRFVESQKKNVLRSEEKCEAPLPSCSQPNTSETDNVLSSRILLSDLSFESNASITTNSSSPIIASDFQILTGVIVGRALLSLL